MTANFSHFFHTRTILAQSWGGGVALRQKSEVFYPAAAVFAIYSAVYTGNFKAYWVLHPSPYPVKSQNTAS